MMNPSLQYQLVFPTVVLCIITVSFYIIGNAFADAAEPQKPCILRRTAQHAGCDLICAGS